MTRLMKKHSMAKGLEPGKVIFIGKQKIDKPLIRITDYTETTFKELQVDTPEDCLPFMEKPSITWINIDGLHDVSVIEKIGKNFGVHSLILEDITNTGQRPKLDISDDSIFLTLKMLYLDQTENHIVSEQFSFLIGSNYVISFQERVGDVFEPVRKRLRKSASRVHFIKPDYLAYTLIDSIVDNYFVVLENAAAQIEQVEDALIEHPEPTDLAVIHDLKRQLILIRKATWPLREVIGGLERSDSQLIDPGTKLFMRDLYEHTI